VIRHTNLQPRPVVRNGVAHQAWSANDYHADVEPGRSVRLWGRRCVGSRPDGFTVGYAPGLPWAPLHEAAQDFLARLEPRQRDQLGELLAGAGPASAADWCEEHGAPDRSLVNVLVAHPRWVPVWQEFDRTFRPGDPAEYDHDNLCSYGPVVRVGAKTVAIDRGDGHTARLDLYTFSWRNWDFDLRKEVEENANTSRHIEHGKET